MARDVLRPGPRFYYQKRYADAEPLAKSARCGVVANDKKSSSDSGLSDLCLALASIRSQRRSTSADAEPLFKRALALQEKELTASHVNTLVTLERLAFVLQRPGKIP